MNKGGKIGLFVVLFVLLGVGGYYGYKMLYKPKEEEDEDIVIIPPPNNSGNGGGGGGGGGSSAPSELDTKAKISDFQNYVINTKKDSAILGSSGADGVWGKNSQKAWDKYGAEYTKSSGVVLSNVDDADIKTIQGFAVKGNGADKSSDGYLKSTNPLFVKKWASKIRDKASAFEWANQVYRTKTGDLLLKWNPLKTTMYIKESGQNLRKSPNQTSSTSFREKGADLGKGGSFANDGKYTYIYLPQERKWINSMRITRTKLSFTGDIEFEQFNGFSNDND